MRGLASGTSGVAWPGNGRVWGRPLALLRTQIRHIVLGITMTKPLICGSKLQLTAKCVGFSGGAAVLGDFDAMSPKCKINSFN